MTKIKKPSLAIWIVGALFLGILAGLALNGNPDIATTYIQPIGTVFLNLIKFIVVPIVFFSIISGIISMSDIHKVGSIGIKTVVYYFITTACALVLSLVIANLFKRFFTVLETSNLAYESDASLNLAETFINIFPSNIISPFANATMLQVIVASILFGYGILIVGEKGQPFAAFVTSASEVCMAIMNLIIKMSPIGVFCLITPVVAQHGASILGNLGMVLLCAYICYALHMLIVYSTTVKTLGGISPLKFYKEMVGAIAFAFSSSSSVGTLPINLETCTKLGAKKDISTFVLPLGATINMDGTAIYQGVCAVFIAACYNIDLTISQMVVIVLTATLASIGTAGVPGSGVIMLAMVLESVNLPLDGIALVIGIDRIFDMGRTVVNITGDASCAIVVSNLENKKEKRVPKLNS